MRKTIFLMLATALLGARMAPAQTNVIGGLQSPFELGGSARTLGMGHASVAITGEADSFYDNPAALATMDQYEILTFHAPLFLDSLYDSVAYVHPIGTHNSFGAAITRLGTSNINQTFNNIQAVSTFSSEQLQGLLGYGFELLDGLDFGANVKYLHEQLQSYQGSDMGLDVGILYHLPRSRQDFNRLGYQNFTVGLAASNALPPQVKLFQAADQPVRVYRPALSYLFLPSPESSFWLTMEGEIYESGTTLFKGGIEYGWNHMIFARAGFDGVSPTAGVGLRLYDFQLDYAFNQRDLGALHRFSLSYRFGRYVDPLQAEKADLLKFVARSYTQTGDYTPAIKAWQNVLKEFPDDTEAPQEIKNLQKQRKNAIEGNLQAAKTAMAQGDLPKALPLLAKVMSLDPGNAEAKRLLQQVDQKEVISVNYTRGVEAYSKEDYASATQYLQAVYELDPHYRDVNFLYHDAESHYLPLQSMTKEMTELYAKGVDCFMAGNYPKAVETWEKVLEKNPKNFLVQRNIEEAKSRMKEKAAGPSGKPQ